MAYRPEGPISAADVFLNILNSASTNLTQILLLQHQKDFSAQRAGTDASETFGTLSGARSPAKPFVVGFIPPDVDVNFVPVERKLSATATSSTSVGSDPDPPNLKSYKFGDFIPYGDSFYLKLAETAARFGANPEDLLAILCSEGGLNPTQTYLGPGSTGPNDTTCVGMNQAISVANKGMGITEDFRKNEYPKLSAEKQLDYIGNGYVFALGGKKVTNSQDMYLLDIAPNALGKPDGYVVWDVEKDKVPDKSLDFNKDGKITAGEIRTLGVFAKNKPLFKKHLVRLKEVLASGKKLGEGPAGAVGSAGSVMTNGVITDPENDDPIYNSGRNIQIAEGPRLAAADAQTQELRMQILVARSIPALALLVNPSKFTRSYEQTVDTVKVRRGYAVHMWNERPLSISCSGTTAAQYAFRADGEGGLTHFNRLHSASYKNLMSLVQVYRNNGHIYRGVTNNDKYNEHVPTISMSVFIYYDGKVYVGSFDDFSVTDDAEKPFNLSYSFKFTVRYEVEISSSGLGRSENERLLA